jgi:HD-GYP domain-containing protein (c-di-GMP phosphodiesterase class II)
MIMAFQIKRVKILYLILVVLLLFGVAPIIFIGSQLTAINSQTLQGKEKVYQVQTVRDKAQQIELYVQGYVAQVISYARAFEISGEMRQAGSRAGQERLARTIEEDTNLIALAVTPQAGPSSFAANSSKINGEEVRRALSEAAREVAGGETYVSAPQIIRSSLEPALIIAQPITQGSSIDGVVMAAVSLHKVFALVAQRGNQDEWQLLHGEQTIFFVVDSEGRAVAHPDEQLAFKRQDMRHLKVVEDWLDSNKLVAATASFTLTRESETLALLGSYASAQLAPDRRVGVIGVINQDAAYISVGLMRRRTLVVTLIAALVAVIASIFFARGFSAPIQSLAAGARALAMGNFSKQLELDTTSSELGQLAEDFNHMSDQLQKHIRELQQSAERNRRLFFGSVRSLAAAIDGKDPYTRGHSERVMLYSVTIAEGLRLPKLEVEKIRISALLHDVGKIGIEDRILRKPAALTDQEFEIMKQHPQKGALIMSENPEMADYIPGMHFHHETLDGRGYPHGLKGDEIPLMARIVSVADCFDAMTTNRPYQRAMTFEDAIERIGTFVGTRYDERVVSALKHAIQHGRIKPDPRVNNVPEAQLTTAAQP